MSRTVENFSDNMLFNNVACISDTKSAKDTRYVMVNKKKIRTLKEAAAA
jgi:hypothetical protein